MFMTKMWSHFTFVSGGLKDQLLAVGGEVSFGILAAEGELSDVVQMLFLRRRWRRESLAFEVH